MTVGSLQSPPFAFWDSPRAFETVYDWVCGYKRGKYKNSAFKTETFHSLTSVEINFLTYDYIITLCPALISRQ